MITWNYEKVIEEIKDDEYYLLSYISSIRGPDNGNNDLKTFTAALRGFNIYIWGIDNTIRFFECNDDDNACTTAKRIVDNGIDIHYLRHVTDGFSALNFYFSCLIRNKKFLPEDEYYINKNFEYTKKLHSLLMSILENYDYLDELYYYRGKLVPIVMVLEYIDIILRWSEFVSMMEEWIDHIVDKKIYKSI